MRVVDVLGMQPEELGTAFEKAIDAGTYERDRLTLALGLGLRLLLATERIAIELEELRHDYKRINGG